MNPCRYCGSIVHIAEYCPYQHKVISERTYTQSEVDALLAKHEAAGELTSRNQRMWDLVRYQRSELHVAELITDDEYAELAIDHPAVKRLENYDVAILHHSRTVWDRAVAATKRRAAERCFSDAVTCDNSDIEYALQLNGDAIMNLEVPYVEEKL